LFVPFSAVRAFVDPAVHFALQFEPFAGAVEADPAVIVEAEHEPEVPAILREVTEREQKPDAKADDKSADVVSIDAFRKKS
jgi:hypothetical protein